MRCQYELLLPAPWNRTNVLMPPGIVARSRCGRTGPSCSRSLWGRERLSSSTGPQSKGAADLMRDPRVTTG
jgi:hypothetical protein